MHLSQVAHAVDGEMLGADVVLHNVAINTRADCEGRLFVALKGENFNAHQFVEQAAKAGASALMVEQTIESTLPQVKVKSTHQALMELATWWRSQFVLPLMAVTGSVGKTTVKEMLSCIFAELGKGVVTTGNLNNEIGAPLTVMRLDADDLYAIVEMGMNQAGEIGRLSHMAKPTIALVNNAAAAHLEGLGTVAAVAQAKGEIYQGLSADGVAVINADDEFADVWYDLAKEHQVLTFGLNSNADVTATYKEKEGRLVLKVSTSKESFKLRVNSVGEHSVRNILAAVTVALAANVPSAIIQRGLANFAPVNGRMNIDSIAGVTVINDTYNANPASMRAAINVLVKNENNTLIVGDMAELGAATETEHKTLGEQAAMRGVKTLLSCGQYAVIVANAFGEGATAFESQSELLSFLKEHTPTGSVLVKGSRSAKMELIVEALHKQLSENAKQATLAESGEP